MLLVDRNTIAFVSKIKNKNISEGLDTIQNYSNIQIIRPKVGMTN